MIYNCSKAMAKKDIMRYNYRTNLGNRYGRRR
jgi:hypothetical protein